MRAIEDTTALVTGATDGLGRGVAERLAALGATVHLHGRDAERLAATRDELAGRPATTASSPTAPTSPRSTRCARWPTRSSGRPAPCTSSSATPASGPGAPAAATRQESRDGLELRFAVNYLAGFALTLRLLGLLRRSAPARVVHVVLGRARRRSTSTTCSSSAATTAAAPTPRASSRRSRPASSSPTARGDRRDRHEPAPGDLHADEDRARAGRPLGRHPRGGRRGDGPPRGRARAEGVTGRFYDRQAEARATRRPTTPTRAGGSGTSAAR